MSKELKKVFMVKLGQYLIYGISLTAVLVRPNSSSNWPFYLVLTGVFLTYFLPVEYRSNFSSADSGLLLKNHTRHLENIIDLALTCLVIFLVVFIDTFRNM